MTEAKKGIRACAISISARSAILISSCFKSLGICDILHPCNMYMTCDSHLTLNSHAPFVPSSHLTPAFSTSVQSVMPMGFAGHSISVCSLPVHLTLSKWTVPTEFWNPVKIAAAPAEQTTNERIKCFPDFALICQHSLVAIVLLCRCFVVSIVVVVTIVVVGILVVVIYQLARSRAVCIQQLHHCCPTGFHRFVPKCCWSRSQHGHYGKNCCQ